MDFSDIFEYLKNTDVDLRVQSPNNERQIDNGTDSDQEGDKRSKMEIEICKADIECWQTEIQKEVKRSEQLMELLNFLKNQVDAVKKMVDSFDGTNDCHEAEMNHIEKLRKEYVQEKYSTNEKTLQEPQIKWPEDKTKREKLNVLRDEIKVLSEMVKKKENKSAVEKELADLRAQKLVLEIQMQRCLQNSSSSEDKNADVQTNLLSNNDEHLSTRPHDSQISSTN